MALSIFQKEMSDFLTSLESDEGLSFLKEKKGEFEEALLFKSPKGREIWIYADGASILSAIEDARFELADYNSLDELASDLKAYLLQNVQER